jgi:transcriptional regulator with XRE-family HTH domain
MIKKSRILAAFGTVVREVRQDKGYSQEKLADLANVHRTYIGMIERAEKNITLENIKKICDALDFTLHDFFKRVQKCL